MSLSPHRIAMLGTGFIADFYTSTLHNQRGIDRVQAVYSRSKERAEAFQSKWNVMHGSDNLEETVSRDDIDTVIIGCLLYTSPSPRDS